MRRLLRAVLVLALVGLPAGCGGDDEPGTAAATTATTATTANPATAPTTTSTLPAPARQTETERVAACLRKEGYRLQGGVPQVKDTESPEFQIILSGPRGGGYIGFYRNATRARRVAVRLRRNATRTSGASVERHGAINVLWVDLPDPNARANVRACLTV